MSQSQAATEFLTGRPAGVSAVSRTAAGLLSTWVENGFSCTVRRNSSGLPYELVAERAGRGTRLVQGYVFVGGVLAGMTGDTIPTAMRAEVMTGGTFQSSVSGGGVYSADRVESRVASLQGANLYADIRNPSASVALTSYPAKIRVACAQGEVFSADQLQVLDATGAAIGWQWEGDVHPATGADIGTYSDGSLRCGSVWVLVSLTAGQTKRYTINVFGQELGQSFTPAITYTVVSGTVEEYATSAIRARFESAQQWQLRRYQDIGNANFDLFTGTNGVFAKYQQSSGVAKFSYNSGDVTGLVRSRPSSGTFGEGVVFRDWRTTFAWTAEPTLSVQIDYRMFADGSIQVLNKWVASANIASASKHVVLQAVVGATGLTGGVDTARQITRYDYTGSPFLIAMTDMVRDYPARVAQVHTASAMQESATTARVGWISTTDIPAGAFFINGFVLTKYTAADQNNEHIRRLNPITAFAAIPKLKPDRVGLRDRANALIDEAIPLMGIQWYGCRSVAKLARGHGVAAARADFDAWAADRALTPSSAASWMALWNGSTGVEYTGRNAQAIWWLREAYRAAGDTTNQTLFESYIHAFADFCVLAEAASGGVGTVWLRLSSGVAAWNAATSCLGGLASSLAITANAGRQTVFDRVLAAYVAAPFAGQKWNYNSTQTVPVDPNGHYYAYQTFELAKVKAILPATTLPTGSLCSYIRENVNGEGAVDDNRFNLYYRRGRESTQMYAAACLVMLDRDYAAAYEATRHISALTARYADGGIDGFGASGNTDVAQDVRVYAELILAGLL